MSDDRMDERLRDFAARWTAARPEPSATTADARRRERSWAPYAAAASVVALVAGVALAVSPTGSREPYAGPSSGSSGSSGSSASSSEPARSASFSPSQRATVPYEPCGEEDVKTTLALTRDDVTGFVNGTLDLEPAGAPCRLPNAPVVDLVGDNRRDLGVSYRFVGEDVPFAVIGTRRLELVWTPPMCPGPPSMLVAIVTMTEHVGSKHPLDPKVVPSCHRYAGATSVLTARWAPRQCSAADWEVVSARLDRSPGYDGLPEVDIGVELRNVSEHFCDVNLKPSLRLVAGDGHEVDVLTMSTDDARNDPAVPPGAVVVAPVRWRSYCGPDLGRYRAFVSLRQETRNEFDPGARPVPGCRRTEGDPEREHATASGDWLRHVRSAVARRAGPTPP